jgi:Flp pilus assembly pilin Flp
MTSLHRLSTDESGGALVEYALLIALIPTVVAVALTAFGHQVSTLFSKVSADL